MNSNKPPRYRVFHGDNCNPHNIPSGREPLLKCPVPLVTYVLAKRSFILAIVVFALFAAASGRGQVVYQSLEDVYTQNFNSLPSTGSTYTWTDNSTIAGWYAANSGSLSFNPAGVTTGSTTTGNLYSFGSSGASDRALGSIGSGSSNAGGFFYGVKLTNDTGVTINAITISYVGEQWRNSAAAAQTVSFQYSLSTTGIKTGTYTSVPALDFTSPVTGGTSGALNGNSTANRTVVGPVTITGIYWPPNATLWIRWSDPDHSGFDHGLSIDDFSFRAAEGSAQYDPPAGYYDSAQGLLGHDLEIALHNIIAPHTIIPYTASGSTDTWVALKVLDEDPFDATKVKLFYSLSSALKTDYGVAWNREHLWPKSRGIDDSGPDSSDLFNIRPADSAVNSARGNKIFDNSDPLDPNYRMPAHANAAPDTSADTNSWQPPTDQRGDVARALFYMHVRYDANTLVDSNTTDLTLGNTIINTSDMGVLSTLLQWHRADPISDDERHRNQLIYTQFQHNRNPFVDNADFAESLFNQIEQSLEDSDLDGMPSSWEQANQFNSSDAIDASQDSDGDGFTNFEEYWMGTDPHNSASPTVLTVDASYTGAVENGSAANPFKRIQAAIDAVPAAELRAIVVKPGVYNERPYSNGKSRIHLFSQAGAAQTIIDGQQVNSSVVRLYGFDKATFSGFTVRNAQTDWLGAGLRVEAGSGTILIDGNIFTNNVTTASSTTGGGGGLYLKTARGSRITNNYITNNSARRGGGVLFAAGNADFWHNTIVGNTATAGLGGGLSALTGVNPNVRNNIIWGNVGTGTDAQAHQLAIANNVLQGAAAGSGNISADPNLLSPVGGIYRIPPDSSARNKAVPVALTVDFDFEQRPETGLAKADMGADEIAVVDADADGVPDYWELDHYGTLGHGADDFDGDGLTNAIEFQIGTSPMDPDSDHDGLSDAYEVYIGTNPLTGDTDNDGMPDRWEIEAGLNPNYNDAASDYDGDGLSALQEYEAGTSAFNSDTDGDGMPDGWEVANGFNPLVDDSWGDADEDGFTNLEEYLLGTTPYLFNPDTDFDRLPDIVDPFPWDFYNALPPRVTSEGGDHQTGIVGSLLVQPITVRVVDSFGRVLRNAPLRISSPTPGVTFAASSAGPFYTTVPLFADIAGKATAYVHLPEVAGTFSVEVKAVTGPWVEALTFTESAVNAPAIAAGEYHTIALGSSGMVWSWGLNSSGQLGDGTKLQRSLPAPVSGLRNVKAISAGSYHSLALKYDGTVWAWGANMYGQLGIENQDDRVLPVQIAGLSNIIAIASGSYHNLALCSDGRVFAWGYNGNGQLGDGSDNSKSVPVVVSGLGAGSGVISIAAGGFHSLAVMSSGLENGWGANYHGALGGTSPRYLTPHLVSPNTLKKAVGGAYHTMSINTADGAEALGWNNDGQLGDATTTSRPSTAAVVGLGNTKTLSASKAVNGHCLALTQSGKVYSWGANYSGQLGRQSTPTNQTIPQEITTLSNIAAIAAGSFHSVALGSDGAIYSWGDNHFGQLGHGMNVDQSQPLRKAGLILMPTAEDTDQDGLDDGWERQHFGNLDQAADGDPDGDGLVNQLEYQTVRNPNRVDYVATEVPPVRSQLVNLSSRADVGVGENILIAGFIISGDAPKRVILRAMGPTLANAGVPASQVLHDPYLKLYDAHGILAENDNWKDDPDQRTLLEGYGMGMQDAEAALVLTLEPGSYTAQISGADGGTGIALFEIYDVTAGGSFLANISARARLQPGDNVLISGFMIRGDTGLRAVIRAIGPSMALYGVADTLSDPHLSLRDASGAPIEINDNWGDAQNVGEIRASGLAPTDPRESTVLRFLPAGDYTAVISASPNSPDQSGVALVEVYDLGSATDSDGDGLTNDEETNVYFTEPYNPDSDGDGLPDGYEVHHGLNPHVKLTDRDDTDGDGVSDWDEYQSGTDPAHFDFVTGNTVGTTQGKIAVGNNGGASYSIPIMVSPGIAGMQPKLSFEYSSRGGNGIMGMGWSLSGLSAITRAPSTLAQDGFIHGVDFSANDRFAMDGQRLIAINGADGANNTEYRTEIESFTKVVSHGQTPTGPQSFEAITKSGLTYTFGGTNDSVFTADRADGGTLSWAVSKIQDRNGNYMAFHYVKPGPGEFLLDSITYTHNSGAQPLSSYASVKFDYEERPDKGVGYMAGSQSQVNVRLKDVTSYFGQQVVRHYHVGYKQSDATRRSLVTAIQEGAGNLLFGPTTFAWSEQPDGLERSPFEGEHPYLEKDGDGNPRERWLEGDFTGDGRSDFIRVTGGLGTALLEVSAAAPESQTQATLTFVTSTWAMGQGGYNASDRWIAGDFDGDGKLDMVRFYDNTGASHHSAVQLYKNSGSGFAVAPCTVTGTLSYKDDALVYPVDINGDGRLDLLSIHAGSDHRTEFHVFLNRGTAGGQTTFEGQLWNLGLDPNGQPIKNQIFQGTADKWLLGDFTGDGLPDIFFLRQVDNGTEIDVYRNLNNRSFARSDWGIAPGPNPNPVIWQTGDFNGDGLVDLLRLDKRLTVNSPLQAIVYLATGDGYRSQQSWNLQGAGNWILMTWINDDKPVRVGDFDGDGRSDFAYVEYVPGSPSRYRRTIFSSNGTTQFVQGETISQDVPNRDALTTLQWLPADFNGDGREDLARFYTFTVGGVKKVVADVWTTQNGARDQLTSVTDAMDSTTTIEYKTLTDPLYSKSASDDVVNDAIDLMAPIPVVSSVGYDDGLGGRYTVGYQYSGLKAHRQRGLLGFRSVRTTDNRTGIWSDVLFRQDFPFTGMAVRSETHQPNGGLLSLSTTDYLEKSLHGGIVHLPYAQQNISESYDLLSGALTTRTTTITNEIDDFGNTKNISVESLDGFKKVTVSNYDVDSSSWQIGKLRNSTVTSSAPGQPDIVRKSGFDYGSTGQVETEKIEPDSTTLWATTTYTPDAFGNTKIATTSGPDIETRATTTLYDERGRFVRFMTNALNQTETRGYDDRWGSVTSVKGPNSLETTSIFDDLGRERLTERADGSRTITTYHWASDDSDAPAVAKYFVRSTVSGAAPVTIFFDRLGREVRRKTFSGVGADGASQAIFVDTVYNEKGQIEKVSRPYFAGATVYFATTIHDLLGRAERIETPKEGGGLAVTTNVYRGLEVDSINPQQQGTSLKTTSRKDSQGHLVLVTDAKNGTIEYIYDATGNLIETHQGGQVTKMKYDVRGRKKEMDDPDLGFWTYGYNSLGELISQTDAKNQTVTMHYDKLGRLDRREEFEGVSTWQYDTAPGKGVGKLHIALFTPADSNLPYQRTMAYDNFGRVKDQTEQIEGNNYTVSTGYGAFSRPETVTYPYGVWVKQLYDANGYVSEVQRSDGTAYWKAKTYDAEGHMKQQQAGNGVVTDRVYVPETGVLKTIQSGLNGGVGVQNLEYEFSVIGNLKTRTDHNQTVNGATLSEAFEYDELNRVLKATVAGQAAKNFAYDLAGNITSKDGVGTYSYVPAAGSLQPDERAHPHAVRQINGGTHATYDKNGNMTSGFGRTISWTSFNMPNLIQRNGVSSRFTYDVEHGRIMQEAAQGGVLRRTIYVGGMFEEVNDGAKIERKHYISSPAGRIAIYTQTVDLTPQHLGETTTDTKFLHSDHLGSVDVVTNEAGAVIERDSFDSWGWRRPTDWQPADTSIRSIITRGYTGHEQLDDLGLVHMNGRVYDPGLGRFLSADPFVQAPTETQNFNRYSYVLNNPLSLTDPSGFNFLNNFGSWLTDNLGTTGAQIVIATLSVAVGYATAGLFGWVGSGIWGAAVASGTFGGAVVAGAGFGFGSTFISSSLSGASLGQAFGSALIGGAIGAITGGIAWELGRLNPSNEFWSAGHLGQTIGHALVGGGVSEIQGGDFGSGALAAGLSAGLAPGINGIGGGSPDIEYVTARVAVSAVIGGTAAEISGGKFANGAVTAAFLRLYNEEHALKALWNVSKASAYQHDQMLMRQAMNHADGTAAGDWYLSPGEVELLRHSPGYEKLVTYLKTAVSARFRGAANGTYQFSTPGVSITFDYQSDAYYAFGSARFWTSGSVVVIDRNIYYNPTITMYDYFNFTPQPWFTPTQMAYRLQSTGYLHPFNTHAYYNGSVSTRR
jgi:RHS repeat-associated protein